MLDPIGDLYQYLASQSALTGVLDSYAGAPAIFAGTIPPDHDIKAPVAVLDYPASAIRRQTNTNINRDLKMSVRIYSRVHFIKDGISQYDTWPLQQAAEAVAAALITARLPISGGVLRGADVTGPIIAPTQDTTIAGRLVTIRWQVEEIPA